MGSTPFSFDVSDELIDEAAEMGLDNFDFFCPQQDIVRP